MNVKHIKHEIISLKAFRINAVFEITIQFPRELYPSIGRMCTTVLNEHLKKDMGIGRKNDTK